MGKKIEKEKEFFSLCKKTPSNFLFLKRRWDGKENRKGKEIA